MADLSSFTALSDGLAAAVAAVAPSVVRVEARRRGNASGIAWSADGLVLGWGRNHKGQIGDGTVNQSLVPVLSTFTP